MSRHVRVAAGRWALMSLVLFGAFASFIVLAFVGRGGAISEPVRLTTMRSLLDMYLPPTALMCAFYFGEKGATTAKERVTSFESLLFSMIIVGLWVLTPPFLIYFCQTVEMVIRSLEALKVYGQTTALAAVAFYFARGKKA